MPLKCCIEGCQSKEKSNIALFSFPTNPEQLSKWVASITKTGQTLSINTAKRVCAKHFRDEHLNYHKTRVLPNGYPSIFEAASPQARKSLFPQEMHVHMSPIEDEPSSSKGAEILLTSTPCAVDERKKALDNSAKSSGKRLFSAFEKECSVSDELLEGRSQLPATEQEQAPEAGCSLSSSDCVLLDRCSVPNLLFSEESTEPENDIITLDCSSTSPTSPEESQEADNLNDSLLLVDSVTPTKSQVDQKNKQLMQQLVKQQFRLIRFVDQPQKIRYYTGFPSYTHLSCFFNILTPECYFLCYVGTANTGSGQDYYTISKRGKKRLLPAMEELFLTLVRLRLGVGETLLGDLFGIDQSYVSRIVNTWILFIYDRVHQFPIWPSFEHATGSAPNFFKDKFPDCMLILDGTEFFIQRPSASLAQRETFSAYKHANTCKIVYGISPNGQVSFISPLYAGRCSDKKIVRHCGVLDKMPRGSGLMVDRGFDIVQDCEERGIKLYIPSFKNGVVQFSEKDLQDSREIASCRVHVERAIRWLKEYSLLSSEIPITLCPLLEQTITVCAHLSNFSGYMVKDR